MATSTVVLLGADVAAEFDALKRARVTASRWVPDCYESESLCRFQVWAAEQGYAEASIQPTVYGYVVRSATGLDGWALLASARRGDIDGSFASALVWARTWARSAPRRFVTMAAADLITAEHRALVHPDGAPCPDGCDGAPKRGAAGVAALLGGMDDDAAAPR